jgi:glycosyltransferase involved in cell wall biosynthesis
MNNMISVVTAVHGPGMRFLTEAYESLQAQELPPSWEWQWVVQEDGTTGEAARLLPDDPRISLGTGRPGGAAVARTMSLHRATGIFTRALDADDLLPEGALARDIATLTTHPELGWCVSACLDLLPDGTLKPGIYDPPAGPLPSDFLLEGYQRRQLQVMGTTLCAHTDLIRALGGWPAVNGSEDVALLLACEAVAPGWMISEPGEIYRKHPDQTTADSSYHNEAERSARIVAFQARVLALKGAGWQWNPRATT